MFLSMVLETYFGQTENINTQFYIHPHLPIQPGLEEEPGRRLDLQIPQIQTPMKT